MIKFFFCYQGVLVPINFSKSDRDIVLSVDADKGSPAEELGLGAMDEIGKELLATGFNKTRLYCRNQADGTERVDRVQIDL